VLVAILVTMVLPFLGPREFDSAAPVNGPTVSIGTRTWPSLRTSVRRYRSGRNVFS
jgi:hypothetical protein